MDVFLYMSGALYYLFFSDQPGTRDGIAYMGKELTEWGKRAIALPAQQGPKQVLIFGRSNCGRNPTVSIQHSKIL